MPLPTHSSPEGSVFMTQEFSLVGPGGMLTPGAPGLQAVSILDIGEASEGFSFVSQLARVAGLHWAAVGTVLDLVVLLENSLHCTFVLNPESNYMFS